MILKSAATACDMSERTEHAEKVNIAGTIVTGQANAGVTVIGIDPGSQCMGWGIVRELSGCPQSVAYGAIRARGDDFSQRLAFIYRELVAVLALHRPDEAAIEQVFTAKNAATALKLGQARGVAVAACAAFDIPVRDLAPTLIKKSLTGVGNAEKSQVSFMVGKLLNRKPDWVADTGDALAAALCHLTMRRYDRLAALCREQR